MGLKANGVLLQENGPIESLDQLAQFCNRDVPVITMFRGELDSTYLLLRLQQLGFTNIHAVAVDVGAPVDEVGLTKHAAHFSAIFKFLYGRDPLSRKASRPPSAPTPTYVGMFLVSSSLTRLVTARLVTGYAKALNAGLLPHTANPSQNSRPRLNKCTQRLSFPRRFRSPYSHSVVSREKKAEKSAAAGLTIMSERKLSGDETCDAGSSRTAHWGIRRVSASRKMRTNGRDAAWIIRPRSSHSQIVWRI
ncbi:hypothetical protein MFIFM68171_03227 [Madurella fahalii]|uniref:Uncharacterized protein n=1 Tax=Madurella fahalii TaxID=1157608 RepID=A0ABQ0G5I1_9PEZI